MTMLRGTPELVGRIFLMILYLYSGGTKISAYPATLGYMASAGVPGALLPLVIAMEMLGSVAIILGWQTRIVSVLGRSLVGHSAARGCERQRARPRGRSHGRRSAPRAGRRGRTRCRSGRVIRAYSVRAAAASASDPSEPEPGGCQGLSAVWRRPDTGQSA